MTTRVSIEQHIPQPKEATVSLTRAAEILGVSKPVVQKGMRGGTIRDLSMTTIGDLAMRPVLDSVQLDGVDVAILRAGNARTYSGEDRPFSGWDIDASDEHLLRGLDRWWKDPGREIILAGGGFLVAIGSVVCAGLRLQDGDRVIERQDGYLRYVADLAGRLTRDGEKRILVDVDDPWYELMDRTLGARVLGGGGGHFTRLG